MLVSLGVSAVFLATKVSFRVVKKMIVIIALISLSVLEWYLLGIKTETTHSCTNDHVYLSKRIRKKK